MKGPEIGSSDRMFAHIGSKSFKRRFCHLRQEVDGTYILELFKDEKKGEAKLTIVMDFCTEVVRNSKRGRYCFELRMSGTHKSYTLAADNEADMQDWLLKLSSVLQHYKQQEEKRAASLERACNTPPPSPQPMQVLKIEISLLHNIQEYHRNSSLNKFYDIQCNLIGFLLFVGLWHIEGFRAKYESTANKVLQRN